MFKGILEIRNDTNRVYTVEEQKTLKNFSFNYADLSDIKIIRFLSGQIWNEIQVYMNNDLTVEYLPIICSRANKVKINLLEPLTEKQVKLVGEIFPENIGKIRKALLLHNDTIANYLQKGYDI